MGWSSWNHYCELGFQLQKVIEMFSNILAVLWCFFFGQELLGISIHWSTRWFAAAFGNIRRPGKGRRDALCRAATCSQSAQQEGDGFPWRPRYLVLNPAKGRSQLTCDIVSGHGSCWIPELHQERLRRAHKLCHGDTQMCLEKLCLHWGICSLDDYKVPVEFFSCFWLVFPESEDQWSHHWAPIRVLLLPAVFPGGPACRDTAGHGSDTSTWEPSLRCTKHSCLLRGMGCQCAT